MHFPNHSKFWQKESACPDNVCLQFYCFSALLKKVFQFFTDIYFFQGGVGKFWYVMYFLDILPFRTKLDF